jgi:hypothetical protein
MTLLHIQSYIPCVLSSGFAIARPAYLRKVKLVSDFWIQSDSARGLCNKRSKRTSPSIDGSKRWRRR